MWETPYTGDSINGVEKLYSKSGRLRSETIYNNGTPGVTKYYYSSGKEIK